MDRLLKFGIGANSSTFQLPRFATPRFKMGVFKTGKFKTGFTENLGQCAGMVYAVTVKSFVYIEPTYLLF